ncbi:hypothetical protein D9M71_598970 [compost metagenome]
MVDLGPAVGGEGKLADLVGTSFGLELLFGLADAGQFRTGVDHPGDEVVVDLMGLAGDPLDAGHRFVFGLVREHRAGGDVTDNPDPWHRRAVVLIGEHAALVGFQADIFQAQALGIRTTADSDQHIVRLQAFTGTAGGRFQAQADTLRRGGGLSDLAAQLETDALLGQCALQGFGGLFVGTGADAVKVFDHGDLTPQTPPYRTQLQADHASADHHQVLGHAGQR